MGIGPRVCLYHHKRTGQTSMSPGGFENKTARADSEICFSLTLSTSTIWRKSLKLTPWSKVHFEKLTVAQLVKKLVSYETRRFITVFTKAFHMTPS